MRFLVTYLFIALFPLVFLYGCSTQTKNVNELAIASKMAGQAYTEGKCDQAITYYMQLIEELPQDLDSRLKVANCIYLQGDSIGAIEQYRNILRSDPTYANAWYNLSYVQLEELRKSLKGVVASATSDSLEHEMILIKAMELLEAYQRSDQSLDLFE